MEANINWAIYLAIKDNKFREWESKYNFSLVWWLSGIVLREKVTNTVMNLSNDDIANACIDFAEKRILLGNTNE